jgi:SPOR domain
MAEPIRLDEGFRPSYRPERAGGWDTDLRRMGLVAAGLGAGVALLVGASSLLRPTHQGIPVVQPDIGPVRVKPLDPGGMKFSGTDIGTSGREGPQLAPAAEQPEIAALKAQLRQVKKALEKQAEETAAAEKIAQTTPPKVATQAPVDLAVATARIAAPKTVATPAVAVPVPAAGTEVQLAAFSSDDAAHSAWASLMQQAPELLRGHKPDISHVDVGGRTMWRLRTGGFATVAEAASFCAKVQARSGSCSIAAF